MDQPPKDLAQNRDARRQEQAASYFARRLGDPCDALRAEVEAWLNADPRNAIAFARISDAWDKAAALRSALPAPEHDPHRTRDAPTDRQGQDQQ